MRIQGHPNTEYLNRLEEQKKSSSKTSAGQTGGAGKSDSAEAAKVNDSLIQAALSAPEVDAKAVEDARRALQSGELDTPEAARRAAERLLNLGL